MRGSFWGMGVTFTVGTALAGHHLGVTAGYDTVGVKIISPKLRLLPCESYRIVI